MDIKRIIKKYYEQLCAHKFDNLGERYQFLERPNLPRLTQEEIDDLNRPISIKEIESTVNNLPKQKASGPDSECYQTFKEEIISVLYNLFQKIKAEGILPNSFYESSITLIPKPDNDITRKLQMNISCEHRCKNPEQNVSKPNPIMYKKNLSESFSAPGVFLPLCLGFCCSLWFALSYTLLFPTPHPIHLMNISSSFSTDRRTVHL